MSRPPLCTECVRLREKVDALRTDRNEWRAVAVHFAGRALDLERHLSRLFPACESEQARHPYQPRAR
ncbi:MAG: hypothetical protein KKD25_01955 [Gammaproteobacteria bacterium]|nr:hypothetical protein [Gammaproteobacteria bacterium]MBU0771811.1 hypothetical protein [Gammaproteobacteria bacterium]MBU0855567.1 hypothetical protein [Gammaproteobacteria bacterium]MBU1846129.1 hypothetical protein [Gammaproteobacteria bacterium]